MLWRCRSVRTWDEVTLAAVRARSVWQRWEQITPVCHKLPHQTAPARNDWLQQYLVHISHTTRPQESRPILPSSYPTPLALLALLHLVALRFLSCTVLVKQLFFLPHLEVFDDSLRVEGIRRNWLPIKHELIRPVRNYFFKLVLFLSRFVHYLTFTTPFSLC